MGFSYKLGLRAIKTAVVVLLCLVIALVFQRENAFYSAIAAVVCLQPTYIETFKLGLNRVIGTIIGGILGYVLLKLSVFVPYYHEYFIILIVPLFILLLIYICNVINKKAAVAICCIVFLSIVANSNRDITDAFGYVANRVIDTTIGIVLAMLVNRFFPSKLKKQAEEINTELSTKAGETYVEENKRSMETQ